MIAAGRMEYSLQASFIIWNLRSLETVVRCTRNKK